MTPGGGDRARRCATHCHLTPRIHCRQFVVDLIADVLKRSVRVSKEIIISSNNEKNAGLVFRNASTL